MTTFISQSDVKAKSVQLLIGMLRSCRPDGSETEEKCVVDWLAPLGCTQDKYGNVYKVIGKDPIVAWSCHTDTVHRVHGYQLITVNEKYDVELDTKSKSNCLGADDTAGLWLMMEMIKANRPGLYIFHRAEEVGAKGSRWIAKNTPHMLKGIKMCIAFDRRGFDNVITFQRGTRCCSDEFATALGHKLGDKYGPDPSGLYTDSASYTDIVAECTNVSVGYQNEHTSRECLSLPHIVALRDKVVALDARDLPIKRKPGDNEARWKTYTNNWEGGYYCHSASAHADNSTGEEPDEFGTSGANYCPSVFTGFFYRDNKYVRCTQAAWNARLAEVNKLKAARALRVQSTTTKTTRGRGVPAVVKSTVPSVPTLARIVQKHPHQVALILEEMGYSSASLLLEIDVLKKKGTVRKPN